MDSLAVGAVAVPPLLRAGVAGGLALARHGTGGLARGVGGRAGLDGIVGADVCRRLVNVHFGLKMGAGGSFLPIFYQKHQFLALSKARKDPTWWFCGVLACKRSSEAVLRSLPACICFIGTRLRSLPACK